MQNVSKQCKNDDWSYYSGNCYYVNSNENKREKYDGALDACIAKGASLAIPNSANEWSFLKKNLPKTDDLNYFVFLLYYIAILAK